MSIYPYPVHLKLTEAGGCLEYCRMLVRVFRHPLYRCLMTFYSLDVTRLCEEMTRPPERGNNDVEDNSFDLLMISASSFQYTLLSSYQSTQDADKDAPLPTLEETVLLRQHRYRSQTRPYR